eukprot:564986-Hanusia_phi.AAC.4
MFLLLTTTLFPRCSTLGCCQKQDDDNAALDFCCCDGDKPYDAQIVCSCGYWFARAEYVRSTKTCEVAGARWEIGKVPTACSTTCGEGTQMYLPICTDVDGVQVATVLSVLCLTRHGCSEKINNVYCAQLTAPKAVEQSCFQGKTIRCLRVRVRLNFHQAVGVSLLTMPPSFSQRLAFPLGAQYKSVVSTGTRSLQAASCRENATCLGSGAFTSDVKSCVPMLSAASRQGGDWTSNIIVITSLLTFIVVEK